MKERHCECCESVLKTRFQKKYCSNKCQLEYQYKSYIQDWKKGKQTGTIGINTRDLSEHLRRYLFRKFKSSCTVCGWNKKHPKTGSCPLEIDHIDGNSENNLEKNLRLICPNCHALTDNFKNRNRGNGRQWRMKKYIKNAA